MPDTPSFRDVSTPLRCPSRNGLPKLRLAATGLLLALTQWACGDSKVVVELPEQLIGKWMTTTESHADTFLDIQRGQIGFGYGGDRSEYFSIFQVTLDKSTTVPLYTIEYMMPDGMTELELFYQEEPNVVRMNHRWEMIWRPASEIEALLAAERRREGEEKKDPFDPEWEWDEGDDEPTLDEGGSEPFDPNEAFPGEGVEPDAALPDAAAAPPAAGLGS